MGKDNFTFKGVDWGVDESQGVRLYYFLDADGVTQTFTQKQYEDAVRLAADQRAMARERWGIQLIIDYKVGTTKGQERKEWRTAQLAFLLGKKIKI